MKALVMTAIFAATSLVTSVANELNNKYAYNYAVDDNNQVTSEMVYKADGKYLEHHLKYDYTYDEAGRVVRKEAYKWNATEQAYERYYGRRVAGICLVERKGGRLHHRQAARGI